LILKTPTVNGGTIRLERKIIEPLPRVQVFPNQLKHVIANLLINGREAMPDGGNLAIEAKGSQSNVEVIVADEGIGIPATILEKKCSSRFSRPRIWGPGSGSRWRAM